MRWKWIAIHTLVVVLILLAALSPLIATAIAGSIAEANGCELHEGFVNPCVIDGVDRGQDLYTAAMLGWFAIATVPIGLVAAAVYLLVVVVVALVRRRWKVVASSQLSEQRQKASLHRHALLLTIGCFLLSGLCD